MNEEKINNAILTLETLIDCCKEDGTYYNAQKEWEALETFKQLQNNWNELKRWLEDNWQESQDIWFVKIINKMQELEQGKDEL